MIFVLYQVGSGRQTVRTSGQVTSGFVPDRQGLGQVRSGLLPTSCRQLVRSDSCQLCTVRSSSSSSLRRRQLLCTRPALTRSLTRSSDAVQTSFADRRCHRQSSRLRSSAINQLAYLLLFGHRRPGQAPGQGQARPGRQAPGSGPSGQTGLSGPYRAPACLLPSCQTRLLPSVRCRALPSGPSSSGPSGTDLLVRSSGPVVVVRQTPAVRSSGPSSIIV